jgi:hypothetical protein
MRGCRIPSPFIDLACSRMKSLALVGLFVHHQHPWFEPRRDFTEE